MQGVTATAKTVLAEKDELDVLEHVPWPRLGDMSEQPGPLGRGELDQTVGEQAVVRHPPAALRIAHPPVPVIANDVEFVSLQLRPSIVDEADQPGVEQTQAGGA